jgi:hypothetical protein
MLHNNIPLFGFFIITLLFRKVIKYYQRIQSFIFFIADAKLYFIISFFTIKVIFMHMQPLDQKTIEDIKQRLVKTYNPREIYLLEPYREDNIDVGILIVVDGKDIEHYDLMKAGHKALIGVKFGKSILVYTQEEFDEYSEDPSTLSYSIKKYGKCIYARA